MAPLFFLLYKGPKDKVALCLALTVPHILQSPRVLHFSHSVTLSLVSALHCITKPHFTTNCSTFSVIYQINDKYVPCRSNRLFFCLSSLSLIFANATIDSQNFWEVLWSVGVTNFILKFFFMGLKCLILLIPSPLMTYRRRVSMICNIIYFAALNQNEC